jgi:hypothetical protein
MASLQAAHHLQQDDFLLLTHPARSMQLRHSPCRNPRCRRLRALSLA